MVVVGSADPKMKTEVEESELAEGEAVPTLAAAVGHQRRVSLTSVGRQHQGLLSSCLHACQQPGPAASTTGVGITSGQEIKGLRKR